MRQGKRPGRSGSIKWKVALLSFARWRGKMEFALLSALRPSAFRRQDSRPVFGPLPNLLCVQMSPSGRHHHTGALSGDAPYLPLLLSYSLPCLLAREVRLAATASTAKNARPPRQSILLIGWMNTKAKPSVEPGDRRDNNRKGEHSLRSRQPFGALDGDTSSACGAGLCATGCSPQRSDLGSHFQVSADSANAPIR